MNWIKINFCENTMDCFNTEHTILDNKMVCDLESMPKDWGNYLVSDGDNIDIAECHSTFHNWSDRFDRKIKNKDIKYWLDFKDISLPQ